MRPPSRSTVRFADSPSLSCRHLPPQQREQRGGRQQGVCGAGALDESAPREQVVWETGMFVNQIEPAVLFLMRVKDIVTTALTKRTKRAIVLERIELAIEAGSTT